MDPPADEHPPPRRPSGAPAPERPGGSPVSRRPGGPRGRSGGPTVPDRPGDPPASRRADGPPVVDRPGGPAAPGEPSPADDPDGSGVVGPGPSIEDVYDPAVVARIDGAGRPGGRRAGTRPASLARAAVPGAMVGPGE